MVSYYTLMVKPKILKRRPYDVSHNGSNKWNHKQITSWQFKTAYEPISDIGNKSIMAKRPNGSYGSNGDDITIWAMVFNVGYLLSVYLHVSLVYGQVLPIPMRITYKVLHMALCFDSHQVRVMGRTLGEGLWPN